MLNNLPHSCLFQHSDLCLWHECRGSPPIRQVYEAMYQGPRGLLGALWGGCLCALIPPNSSWVHCHCCLLQCATIANLINLLPHTQSKQKEYHAPSYITLCVFSSNAEMQLLLTGIIQMMENLHLCWPFKRNLIWRRRCGSRGSKVALGSVPDCSSQWHSYRGCNTQSFAGRFTVVCKGSHSLEPFKAGGQK